MPKQTEPAGLGARIKPRDLALFPWLALEILMCGGAFAAIALDADPGAIFTLMVLMTISTAPIFVGTRTPDTPEQAKFRRLCHELGLTRRGRRDMAFHVALTHLGRARASEIHREAAYLLRRSEWTLTLPYVFLYEKEKAGQIRSEWGQPSEPGGPRPRYYMLAD